MKKRLFDRVVDFIHVGYFGWKLQFDIDLEDSKRFLYSIKEPRDDIDRAYAQYKCQCYLRRKMATVLLNIACAFGIIPYIIKGMLGKVVHKDNKDIVYSISIIDKRIIPPSLRAKYDSEYITNEYDGVLLKKEDLGFIWKLYRRYPFSFFFILRIILKISFYRYFIEEYHPKAIAINSEFSCTSAVMTMYCEQMGITHINIMHGEKMFYIRDSFFRFSECYVWDNFYVELFKFLRVPDGQFVVDKPESLIIDIEKYKGSQQAVDYKYMLNGNEKIDVISESLHKLKKMGFVVMVRPHPTYTDTDLLKQYFSEDEIENCKVSIEESISNTSFVISLYSTVLLQAYMSGINIVMDDVNYKREYQKLKDLKYILINKPHQLLSEVLSGNTEKQ